MNSSEHKELKMSTVWNITQMKRLPGTDLIVEVDYEVVMRSNKYMGPRISINSIENNTILLEGDPTSPTFIPYEKLTEEQIIAWVKAALGEENITNIKQRLVEKIERKIEIINEREANKSELLEGKPWNRPPLIN